MGTSRVKTQQGAPAWYKLAAFALVLAAFAAVWRYTPLAEYLTAEQVSGWARMLGSTWWAPYALIVVYTPAAFVMFPRPLITLTAVIAFGAWAGFACAIAGITVAALASYVAGRAMPRATVRRIAGAKLDAMSKVLRKKGFLAVLAVRIVPVAPFVVIGIVAGALRIKLWHFVAATVVGVLPGTLATTVFGDQLQAALEDPSRINYWVVGGVALVFAVMTVMMRRWFAKQHRGALSH